jgi:hypothetical protein
VIKCVFYLYFCYIYNFSYAYIHPAWVHHQLMRSKLGADGIGSVRGLSRSSLT